MQNDEGAELSEISDSFLWWLMILCYVYLVPVFTTGLVVVSFQTILFEADHRENCVGNFI